MRPLLCITFPQGFRISILDIQLQEKGAKRRINGTSKVNTHSDRWTDGQTDRQTDKSTYREPRPRGPMLWKILNSKSIGLNKKKMLLEMILDLGKCPNQKMHKSERAVFSPMSEIISENSFLIKSYKLLF